MAIGAHHLIKQELKLHASQANDALHEIWLALVDKAVLFHTNIWHASSHTKTMRAWGKVNAVDALLTRQVTIYRKCQSVMINLSAKDDMLARYQVLKDEDLKVNTAVTEPNSCNHHTNNLAWFWSMDIPGDTKMNDWMSGCKLHVFMTSFNQHYTYQQSTRYIGCT